MNKILSSFILAFCLLVPNYANSSEVNTFQPVGANNFGANKVTGLELPADQTVSPDEGFINIQAVCDGEIKWLVVSGSRVKYITIPQTKSIVISIPPQGGTITVFAVGLVGGKLTDFARTNITIGRNANGTNPPNPPRPPAAGPIHITFLVDLDNMTPDLAQIVNSQTLRQTISAKGNFFRLYDFKSPVIAAKKLDAIISRIGGNAIIVIQRNDGFVLTAEKVPNTEAAVLQLINQYNRK